MMTGAADGTSPTIGLVVVNFASAGLTDVLLTSVADGADDVVVVDCTPHETGLADVTERHGARLLEPGTNLGYGAGANLGAATLSTDVIAVANPDLEIPGDGLRALAERALGVGLVAPRFTFPDGRLQPSAHRREPTVLSTLWDMSVAFGAIATRLRPGWNPTLLRDAEHDLPRDVLHVLGALMVIDARAFTAVGGFDPAFFLYREETDLCRRLRAGGWRVRHEPDVTVVHHLHGTTPGPATWAPSDQRLRSHYRYVGKHWGRAARLALRAIGTLAAATSVISGPDRRLRLQVLRWHLWGR